MPKSPIKFAAEIQARMKSESKQVLTMNWSDFYDQAEIKRFRAERADEIAGACKALNTVVGYGNNVVTFCHDADFAA